MRYVLESVHWNQTKASEILDLHRNTLSRLIKEFKLG
jgi:DNA-binding protein Fis